MAPRLVDLRRVMKRTAVIYLRCNPTASHYLEMLLDAVFGEPQRAYAVHCGCHISASCHRRVWATPCRTSLREGGSHWCQKRQWG
jgi:hypothetical protein